MDYYVEKTDLAYAKRVRQDRTSELRKLWKTIIRGVQLITSGFTYILQTIYLLSKSKRRHALDFSV